MPLAATDKENVANVRHNAPFLFIDPGRVAFVNVEFAPAHLIFGRFVAASERVGPEGRAGIRHVDGDGAAGVGIDLAQPLDEIQRYAAFVFIFRGETDDKAEIGLDVRRVFGQIAHAPFDHPRFLVFGDAIQHGLRTRFRADVHPLTTRFVHPFHEFGLEQLHPHLTAPGQAHGLDHALHGFDAPKKIVVRIVHRVHAMMFLQPLHLLNDERFGMGPPGAFHHHFVVAETATERAAARNVDGNCPIIRPGLQKIGGNIGQKLPARAKIIQIGDERSRRVDMRLAAFVAPGQSQHIFEASPVEQRLGEFLRGHLAFVDDHEIDIIFFEHFFGHDGGVHSAPNCGHAQGLHPASRLDGGSKLRPGDGAESHPIRSLLLHQTHEIAPSFACFMENANPMPLLHERIRHIHNAKRRIHIAMIAEVDQKDICGHDGVCGNR